jgi:hypothetical protein
LILKEDFDFLKRLKIKNEQQREIKEISKNYFSFIKESQT